MNDEEIFEALNKFDASRENFGFDEEIKLTREDPREKQRKFWKIKTCYIRSGGEKMQPLLVESHKERTLTLEAEDVRGGRIKKQKRKGYYTEKILPEISFDKEKVLQVLVRVVSEFAGTTITNYDSELAKDYSFTLASKLLEEIYKLNFERHKLLILVRIVEDLNQYIKTMISFLWDCDFDGHAHYTHKGYGYMIIVSVYGFYIE